MSALRIQSWKIWPALILACGLQASIGLCQDAPPITAAVAAVIANPAEAAELKARRAAVSEEQAAVARERLYLDTLREDHARRLKSLDIGSIVGDTVEQAELDADTARVNLGSTEVELQGARQQLVRLREIIQTLAERRAMLLNLPSTQSAEELGDLDSELAVQQPLLGLEEQHQANLEAARYIAAQRLELATRWADELRRQYKTARELSDKAALGQLQQRLGEEQRTLQTQMADVRRRLDASNSAQTRNRLEAQLAEVEELSKLKQTDLALAQAQARLNSIEAVLSNSAADTRELSDTLKQSAALLLELAARQELLKNKLALVKQQRDVVLKELALPAQRDQAVRDAGLLKKISESLDRQGKQLVFLQQSARQQNTQAKALHQKSLRDGMLTRQSFPKDTAAWRELGQELGAWPGLLWQTTVMPLALAARAATGFGLLLAALLAAAWLGFMAWLHSYLVRAMARLPTRQNLLTDVLGVVTRLLRANSISIGVLGALFILFVLAGSPQPGTGIFVILAGAWLCYKVAIDLTQLLLMDAQFVRNRTYPRLYFGLRWGILLLAVLTPLMLLGHFTDASGTLRDFNDRLFMLLLLPALLMLLRGRGLILGPLSVALTARWLALAERIIVILALALLASVGVGLSGFINLAWAIALHVGLFLLVLGVWLLLRGLLRDLVRLIKNRLSPAQYGVAGSQSLAENLVDPLHHLIQIALFLLACWNLFRLYGWDAESPAVRSARQMLLTPLFEIGQQSVTLFSILLSIVIVLAVLRVGRWSRELTYRWLFFKIANSGTRHSLSVFLQYAVVLIGFLVALRVLGIDLTTLTVFAGALGVGIGFGLQNIANNFISGILLLIERPVRTGDTVTIGSSEGAVTRIGIRSLTLQTADNLEVIIPNADVISHPFTNWTFSDTVVRTTLVIPVSYHNDLRRVHTLIEEVLRRQTALLRPAQAGVWLEEMSGATVNFRVQYFIDLSSQSSSAVKSGFLLEVWERLAREGVRFPGIQAEPPPG